MITAYTSKKKEVTAFLEPALKSIVNLGSKTRGEVVEVILAKVEAKRFDKYRVQLDQALYFLEESQVWIIMNEVLIHHCFLFLSEIFSE